MYVLDNGEGSFMIVFLERNRKWAEELVNALQEDELIIVVFWGLTVISRVEDVVVSTIEEGKYLEK